jgi:hypothetical protein
MNRYFATAFLYSGIRKLVYTWDAKYRDVSYDENHNKITTERPVLHVDRCMHFLYAGTIGTAVFPINLLCDIRNTEMYIRNIKSPPYWLELPGNKGFLDVLCDLHL